MKFLRTHPVFSVIMLAIFFVILGELWFVSRVGETEANLEQEIAARINEIERLKLRNPGPTKPNLAAARRDLAENGRVLATMLQVLNVTSPEELAYFQGEPGTRTDAFFDIASFVDRLRDSAAEIGISLEEDERFGFSLYTNEGPENALIQPVYRQRRIVEYLLGKLFEARPRRLLSVQREDPSLLVNLGDPDAPPPPEPERSSAGRAPSDKDIFTIDTQVSARTRKYVDTMAFRIAFAGQTSALRGLLNFLAAPEIPLVVRSVEVEPYQVKTAAKPAPIRPTRRGTKGQNDVEDSANIPIVAENVSRFTVTVEMFVVKIRPPDVPAEEEEP